MEKISAFDSRIKELFVKRTMIEKDIENFTTDVNDLLSDLKGKQERIDKNRQNEGFLKEYESMEILLNNLTQRCGTW